MAGRAVQLGNYDDGRRCDDLGYLQCKLILKPDRFTSAHVFKEFADLVQRAADETGVGYHHTPKSQQRPEVREVLFLDTGGFHLYNNAFIVRRRIAYEDGFAIGDPEIVFKYRSADMKAAQSIDVRPRIDGKYKIKFKIEIMPLKERIGGMRRLLSHNVEFGLSQAPQAERIVMSSLGHMSLPELAQHLPAAGDDLVRRSGRRVAGQPVHRRGAVAGHLPARFRPSHGAPPPISPCGARAATIIAFVGEFAYQLRFDGPDDISPKSLQACERFFLELQQVAGDWLALTTTKTGAVYRLRGNPPQAHE